jgi:hypothetical protein
LARIYAGLNIKSPLKPVSINARPRSCTQYWSPAWFQVRRDRQAAVDGGGHLLAFLATSNRHGRACHRRGSDAASIAQLRCAKVG